MKERIEELNLSFTEALGKAITEEELETLRIAYLGKKGYIAQLMQSLRDVADKKTAGQIMRDLRNSQKAPGCDRIYTAGEKEYDVWMERKDKGVPVSESIQKEFVALRDECGLDYKFPFED